MAVIGGAEVSSPRRSCAHPPEAETPIQGLQHPTMDLDQTSERANWHADVLEEWTRQFTMLSLEAQQPIAQAPLGPEADRLEVAVETAVADKRRFSAEFDLCQRNR